MAEGDTDLPSRRRLLQYALGVPILVTGSQACLASAAGRFEGRVVAEWLPDGRKMLLREWFEYIDVNNRRWHVPAGITVDGASIPQVFWSIIGGPFEGPYRAASVIHDYYCDRRTRPFHQVHRVFYDGMLTAGVGGPRAWLMYQAVVNFGPRWPTPKIDPRCEIADENYDFERCTQNARPAPLSRPKATREDLIKFAGSLEGKADPEDLRILRNAINKM